MIGMSTVHSIRQMRKRGDSISEITRKMGLSRNTVYAKLEEPDLAPPIPMRRRGDRMLDAYRGVISAWLDEDSRQWRKRRHAARRVWQRLRDEHGVSCSESTVRHYAAEMRRERRPAADGYLELV